jgi:hypothetical protein
MEAASPGGRRAESPARPRSPSAMRAGGAGAEGAGAARPGSPARAAARAAAPGAAATADGRGRPTSPVRPRPRSPPRGADAAAGSSSPSGRSPTQRGQQRLAAMRGLAQRLMRPAPTRAAAAARAAADAPAPSGGARPAGAGPPAAAAAEDAGVRSLVQPRGRGSRSAGARAEFWAAQLTPDAAADTWVQPPAGQAHGDDGERGPGELPARSGGSAGQSAAASWLPRAPSEGQPTSPGAEHAGSAPLASPVSAAISVPRSTWFSPAVGGGEAARSLNSGAVGQESGVSSSPGLATAPLRAVAPRPGSPRRGSDGGGVGVISERDGEGAGGAGGSDRDGEGGDEPRGVVDARVPTPAALRAALQARVQGAAPPLLGAQRHQGPVRPWSAPFAAAAFAGKVLSPPASRPGTSAGGVVEGEPGSAAGEAMPGPGGSPIPEVDGEAPEALAAVPAPASLEGVSEGGSAQADAAAATAAVATSRVGMFTLGGAGPAQAAPAEQPPAPAGRASARPGKAEEPPPPAKAAPGADAGRHDPQAAHSRAEAPGQLTAGSGGVFSSRAGDPGPRTPLRARTGSKSGEPSGAGSVGKGPDAGAERPEGKPKAVAEGGSRRRCTPRTALCTTVPLVLLLVGAAVGLGVGLSQRRAVQQAAPGGGGPAAGIGDASRAGGGFTLVEYEVTATVDPPPGAPPSWGCADVLGGSNYTVSRGAPGCCKGERGPRMASRRTARHCQAILPRLPLPPPPPSPQANSSKFGAGLIAAYSAALGLPREAFNVLAANCAPAPARAPSAAAGVAAGQAPARREASRRLHERQLLQEADASAAAPGPGPVQVTTRFTVAVPNGAQGGARAGPDLRFCAGPLAATSHRGCRTRLCKRGPPSPHHAAPPCSQTAPAFWRRSAPG